MDSNVNTPLSNELVYLNRLGDLLFVLARVVNARAGCFETEWNVGRKKAPSA
jgi:cob(I)alamin adenosyltransferase